MLNAVKRLKKTRNPEEKEQLKQHIEDKNREIFNNAGIKELKKEAEQEVKKISIPSPKRIQQLEQETFKNLTKEEKKEYLKVLGLKPRELKKLLKEEEKKKESKKLKEEDYSIYEPSKYGKIANKYAKNHADELVKKYPELFESLFNAFEQVDISILSRTYISMMIFYSILSLPTFLVVFFILNFAFKLGFFTVILISIAATIATVLGFYFYPASLKGQKNKKIKQDLPFAIVHMSAVAGSGAHPLSIFELIAQTEEYPELKKEIKKILNQVNLFGYNLTTALKNVARTTPSPEFKELLNGMISTIETGGDLKAYLKEKAEESLDTFKLDMKKRTEAIATYSEIYTAVLIASPLLLIITLAIINSIGGRIAGLSVTTIAWIGIGGIMPLLNIAFMGFLTLSEK